MTVILFFLCLLVLSAVYVHLRYVLLRSRMHRRIAEMCKRADCVLERRKGGGYSIDIGGRIIRVTVIGARSRRARLVFCENMTYRFERRISIPLRFEQAAVFPFSGRVHTVPGDADVILLCPVCAQIVMRESHTGQVILGDGDKVGKALLYSLSGLIGAFEKEQEKKEKNLPCGGLFCP